LVCELGEPQRFVFPIVESGSWLDRQAQALGCERWFSLPPDAALPEQALSMSSLLPAAMLGLDCIKLLEGAVMINEHFKSTPAGENVVLQWVAIHRLLAQHRGITRRSIRPWASALDWLPSWYQSIRGGDDLSLSAKSITVNVVAKQPRYDPVAIANHAGDGHSGSLVGRMVQTMESANLAARDAGNPTVTLNLPTVDTRVLGQIFQMLLIATRIDTPALPCSA
jgi:glucose-6-phosphate isomerase